jgi:hypothetical protein
VLALEVSWRLKLAVITTSVLEVKHPLFFSGLIFRVEKRMLSRLIFADIL